jgi:hypothetical protein
VNKVFIDVEYGYQYFLWETTEDPVKVFHENMPETCLDPPDVLPGKLTEVTRRPHDITQYVGWHETGDSFIIKGKTHD